MATLYSAGGDLMKIIIRKNNSFEQMRTIYTLATGATMIFYLLLMQGCAPHIVNGKQAAGNGL
jgi:hypothetical protein